MTSTRTCDRCHNTFTPAANNPNQRFCSNRCRKAWHHHNRRRDDVPALTTDDVHIATTSHDDVNPRLACTTDAVPTTQTTTAAGVVPDVPNTANGQQRCPHCREPIAIIALLVPPQAAIVRTPQVTSMTG